MHFDLKTLANTFQCLAVINKVKVRDYFSTMTVNTKSRPWLV